ncbi:MAG: hypothetical protein ACYDEX_13915 [Mobilitalea sp.]
MPRHEFGIMQSEPIKGIRFDKYEPEKYNCISIDDDCLGPLLTELSNFNFYWHTIDIQGKGLAYWGITLIPPKSLDPIIDKFINITELSLLRELLLKAKVDNKYVIHFGI